LHRYPPGQILALALYELQVKHPNETIEECNKALQASSDPIIKAAAMSELGQAHLQLRHYDQAAASFQAALRVSPEDGMALMGSGVLALRQGQYDFAVAQLAHAMKVDPSDLNVLLLAQALRHAGHAVEADSLSQQVQKIAADPAQAQVAAAEVLGFAGLKPL
jgi:tetratricopeptide (TPR) repeat protein